MFENEFIGNPLSLRMKALGFNQTCLKSYGKDGLLNMHDHEMYLSAPTWHSAFVWFDENTEYRGFVTATIKNGDKKFNWEIRNSDNLIIEFDESYPSRVEATLYCLEALCELVEDEDLDDDD